MLTLIHTHRHIPSKYTHIHTHTSHCHMHVTQTHTHSYIYRQACTPRLTHSDHSSNTLVHTYAPLYSFLLRLQSPVLWILEIWNVQGKAGKPVSGFLAHTAAPLLYPPSCHQSLWDCGPNHGSATCRDHSVLRTTDTCEHLPATPTPPPPPGLQLRETHRRVRPSAQWCGGRARAQEPRT